HLVEEVIPAGQKRGTELTFRTAMNVDHHRSLAAESSGRLIEEAGDPALVETLPADQLGLDELLGVQPAGFTVGPAIDLVKDQVQRINVHGRAGGNQREAEVLVVVVPMNAGDGAGGQLGQRLFLS